MIYSSFIITLYSIINTYTIAKTDGEPSASDMKAMSEGMLA
jgi:hypothetical protein